MKIIYYLILFLILLDLSSASVQINEIMYDPNQCPDNLCEWVELYNPNNHTINLSTCIIFDKELTNKSILPKDYLMILRDHNNFSHFFHNPENYIQLSFTLNNGGEEIILYGNESCDDSFDYTYLTEENFADGDGFSLERREDNSWGESRLIDGTPGSINSIFNLSINYDELFINEFFPRSGDDGGPKPFGEWVEIYNPSSNSIDLKGLRITDNTFDHEIFVSDSTIFSDETIILPHDYLVVYRNGDSDFSLNNNGYDEVNLYHQDDLIDSVSYSNTIDGMSWSIIDDSWQLTVPTPDKKNVYTPFCDWEIKIDSNEKIFGDNGLDFNVSVSRLFGSDSNLTVTGVIIDQFGDTIKSYNPFTNVNVPTKKIKSYSPNLQDGVYQIYFSISNNTCNDTNLNNNHESSLVLINSDYKVNYSSLKIDSVYIGSDDQVKWGETFRVKVNIYKGKETKHAVELWSEKDGDKISKTTKLNLYDQYENNTLTLPIQLFPNCNSKISDGEAEIILEGLDLSDKFLINVKGLDKELCRDYLSYLEELDQKESQENLPSNLGQASNSKFSFQFIDLQQRFSPSSKFPLSVKFQGDDQKHEIKTWPYVYKGPRCYSCQEKIKDRDHLMKSFTLNEYEVKNILFLIELDSGMAEGLYNLKLLINKDDQKTNKELKEEIFISDNPYDSGSFVNSSDKFKLNDSDLNKTINDLLKSNISNSLRTTSSLSVNTGINSNFQLENNLHHLPGKIVYEASSENAKNSLPFLIIFLLMLSIVVIYKQK